ncbi:hypothetical protein APHCRT_0763 [Anaplasma phagocytophilum str. CRT53-1]|uniref:Uncharacterized protein n=1 Tax=Anaplasma phagocytophilum str. CRT53-1 TaxID=1359157 RepID=A0A0F3Q0S8_ANAPH|nr:hypothetical protein APHCRT_0763 [Anaplasma phagocytophilum str. CRT53-1]
MYCIALGVGKVLEKYVFSVSCAFQAKLVSVPAPSMVSMVPYTFWL